MRRWSRVEASAGRSRTRDDAAADDRRLAAQERRPRSSACRPPAGPRRARGARRRRRRGRDASKVPRRSSPPAAPALADQTTSRPTASRRTSPARLVGADLALELDRGRDGSRRPSSRRSGRVRVAPSLGCGRRRRARRASHGPRLRSSRPSRRQRERRLEPGVVSSPSSGDALLGDDRAGVEARVHPHQRHAGLARRRRGSRPGSASRRGGAAAATDGGSARRARGRAARPGRSGRSRRGRGARARAPGRRAIDSGARRRSGVRIVLEPELVGRLVDDRVASDACCRPAGRGGAVTTPTRSTSSCPSSAPEARAAERAAPRKTVRGPRAARCARSGHARALVASRTSASSSLPAPTGISSSIESR